ncbi:hypothetical protein [Clavibacter michiganensis]|uniref:hypothetical protein n=1 Tax=Clavibacter michiganensis TaxID=28447 RepID=UPI00292F47C5|nr:hypothetical protein [Clavibacter michiganensis]
MNDARREHVMGHGYSQEQGESFDPAEREEWDKASLAEAERMSDEARQAEWDRQDDLDTQALASSEWEVTLPTGRTILMLLNPTIPPRAGSKAVRQVLAKLTTNRAAGPGDVWGFEFALEPALLPFGEHTLLDVAVRVALTKPSASNQTMIPDEHLQAEASVDVARNQTRADLHVVTMWPEALAFDRVTAEFTVTPAR